MLRRLASDQPASFAFTADNLAWAEGQIAKYPAGRQASAIIPLLYRAQEQEGWLSQPAMEYIADMLGMAHIRALEVATFYFMFHLQPVGQVAHIQICGTTTCMICGAGDLIDVCKEVIAPNPHELSADGKFSWEEVECLGACTNAPMAAIGKDYYEDLTAEGFRQMLSDMAEGKFVQPGPQNGRFAAEPVSGLVALTEVGDDKPAYNATVSRQMDVRDGLKRIDGTEVPLLTPWISHGALDADKRATPVANSPKAEAAPRVNTDTATVPADVTEPRPAKGKPVDGTGVTEQEATAVNKGAPEGKSNPDAAESDASEEAKLSPEEVKALRAERRARRAAKAEAAAENEADTGRKPAMLSAARDGNADDLKMIKGVGPKLEKLLNSMGIYHFDQVAAWEADELAWVDANLEGFKGRASRDDWVAQAKLLASGEETEFSKRAKY
ncbi:NADH-quinone oxidoreductase chain 2 [Aquimixticola soesokkakensis]|uniref:NADH-quinone oxidoreductase chain 2 n=1 Tax=Aquimixticola soesokkakensis TaxID=1519096 RepID=A0A1Y5S2L9_9RHOB|nr:NADH-quinone oxidoreductase subunit E [Aquimixticola soesokkakensis]SLN30697.1 NADH-quinone oxidoreductase chain 2 [Aquimixticola soesokkakensis]